MRILRVSRPSLRGPAIVVGLWRRFHGDPGERDNGQTTIVLLGFTLVTLLLPFAIAGGVVALVSLAVPGRRARA